MAKTHNKVIRTAVVVAQLHNYIVDFEQVFISHNLNKFLQAG